MQKQALQIIIQQHEQFAHVLQETFLTLQCISSGLRTSEVWQQGFLVEVVYFHLFENGSEFAG